MQREQEKDLIIKFRNGNEESLKEVYKSYYPVIKSLVLRNNGSEYEAKDVFQESVIILYEKLQHPEFNLTCSIKTFLYAVSRRLWLKKWNEKKTRVYDTQFEDEPESLDTIMDENGNGKDELDRMREALERLGEPCAGLLKDFYLRNYTMTDISEKYGYTNADNAKNQKYKCLQRLKRIFFNEEASNKGQ